MDAKQAIGIIQSDDLSRPESWETDLENLVVLLHSALGYALDTAQHYTPSFGGGEGDPLMRAAWALWDGQEAGVTQSMEWDARKAALTPESAQ